MSATRVLIVDDSVVVRTMVGDVLSAEPDLDVVGSAASGPIALAKLGQLAPDVVILDVEMPGMSGLQVLAAIRTSHPRLPVIMFSTLTERGAVATIEALSVGATDYVTKPSSVGSAGAAMQRIHEELVPKIRTFCRREKVESGKPPPLRPLSTTTSRRVAARSGQVDVVAIGSSTGGPAALHDLVPRLPANFPAPIVVVQHMPEIFTKLFAERLDAAAAITVSEGVSGEALRPGHVSIAPGDRHMVLERSGSKVQIRMHREEPKNSCRPSVDLLFSSAAEVYGPGTLAVVLTGMGQDGCEGCARVREAGGQVIVQDEASSVVWGMPGVVAKAGLADRVVPLDNLASELVRRVGPGGVPAGSGETR